MAGLPVSRLVKASINLAPQAAATRSFGILLAAGDSSVISGLERYRSYDDFEGVETDFGTNAPETKAAQAYFGQTPQPAKMMIGRWLRVATSAFLNGGQLSPAQQLMSNFTSITSGGFDVTIDGVVKTVTGLNFSSAGNINAVVVDINAVLTGGVISFDGTKFIITSNTTGTSSSVSYVTPPAGGQDISTLLQLTAALASTPVPGYAAETPVQCAAALCNLTSLFFGLTFQASVQPTDDQSMDISSFIEALDTKRMYGVTITNAQVLDSTITNDLASRMKAAGFLQSFCQYSQNAYAINSLFGRAFSVDFNANNSTITLMFKQEPGIAAENLSSNQADTLQNKRCNVFVTYDNSTNIIQYGVMSGPAYIDEIHGIDWFQNRVQTDQYNLLYTSTTKIPQTDAGQNMLVTTAQGSCDAAVNNGLVAPGVWTGPNVGQLKTGQYLKSGYYIFAESLALQSQADRDARKAPPMTICVKFAGAFQEVDMILDVNR